MEEEQIVGNMGEYYEYLWSNISLSVENIISTISTIYH